MNEKMKNIALVALGILTIYLGLTIKELKSNVARLEEACGADCENLFINFNVDGLAEALDSVSIDRGGVKACLDSSEMTARVNKDFDDAQQLGVSGTPANFLVNKETGLGVLVPGAYPSQILENVKNYLLKPEARVGDMAYQDETGRISLQVAQFPDLDSITEADNIKGPADAKVALVEYSDFDCPHCKTFQPVANQFVSQNPDVQWVFRYYPLRNIHPDAQKKAEAAECVKKLHGMDKYWEFVEALYQQTRG